MVDNPDDLHEEVARPSKSERKRAMLALQEMGERLVSLPQADLEKISIEDEQLQDAIELARRITARGGRKRQLQFIGKLMRSVDVESIREGLSALDQQHVQRAAEFHRIEKARDRLRDEGDDAVGDTLATWPQAEASWLRQWIRQHPTEVARGNEKSHLRKLFRYLADLDQSAEAEF